MADVLTTDDLIADKKHSNFFAEVVTGKTGGLSTGADIATSTNQVTGQTQKTLPQVLADLGMVVQTWTATSGGTLTNAAQVFLNDKVGSTGLGNYYAWSGTFPKVVSPGLDPAITAGFIMRSDSGLRRDLSGVDGPSLIGTEFNVTLADVLSAVRMNSRWLGLVYGTSVEAANNTAKLVAASAAGVTDLVLDMHEDLYLNALTLNDNSCLFKSVKITSSVGKKLYLTGTGSIFTVASNGTFDIDPGVTISAPLDTQIKLFATPYNTDTRIERLSVKSANIYGWVRFVVETNKFWTQDPSLFINGVSKLIVKNNTFSHTGDACFDTTNAMYDNVTIKNNVLINMRGTFFADIMVNSTANHDAVKTQKKFMNVSNNKIMNDRGFFADPADVTSYVCFILHEGYACEYKNNFVKGLVRQTDGDGVYDIYMGGFFYDMAGNETWDKFDFSASAKLVDTRNVSIKLKQATNININGHVHDYTDGFFEYYSTNHGLTTEGHHGDFMPQEQLGGTPGGTVGYTIVAKNMRLVQKVLASTPRDGYYARTMIIEDSVFVSLGSGYSTILRVKCDSTVNIGNDSWNKKFSVNDCEFHLPNTAGLMIADVLVAGSQPLTIDIKNNSGLVKNITLCRLGCQTPLATGITGVNFSGNKFYSDGAVARIMNEFSLPPSMTYLISEDNSFDAKPATSLSGVFGVMNTAASVTVSGKLQTDIVGNVLVDVIDSKDSAAPTSVVGGHYTVRGFSLETDANGYFHRKSFEFSYFIDTTQPISTYVTFINTSALSTSVVSGITGTKFPQITGDSTKVTASISAGVIGAKVIAVNLVLAAGVSLIDYEIVKNT